jgi:hypothetical protein
LEAAAFATGPINTARFFIIILILEPGLSSLVRCKNAAAILVKLDELLEGFEFGSCTMSVEDSASPEILYPAWQNEYQAAVEELDPVRLRGLIEAAEAAIFKRLQQLSNNDNHHAERQVIEDALASLRVMQREVLGFPDWEKKK